jgi:hypothetical protein
MSLTAAKSRAADSLIRSGITRAMAMTLRWFGAWLLRHLPDR